MSKVVWFIHPDLGIGGAEMLVVNAAVALQKKGYEVSIFTSHHDVSHCFAETKVGGSLYTNVQVYGDFIPRTIAGRLHVVCAVLRMIWVSCRMILLRWFGGMSSPDVVICDQVSHVVPLLRYGICVPVLFYCHFPDKLLCVERGSLLKRLYRAPVDFLEELTTGMAHLVLVNSKFTQEVFKRSFTSLVNLDTKVLYPAIDLTEFDRELTPEKHDDAFQSLPEPFMKHLSRYQKDSILLLSINRFERKKNILLAIESLKKLVNEPQAFNTDTLHLLLAGGYDPRVEENVSYMQDLTHAVSEAGLNNRVSFLKSFTNDQRLLLMSMSRCVVYTPDREHFGIVPIEAMYAGCPVVAVASGGPLESIVHGETGFLEKQTSDDFAKAIGILASDAALAKTMGLKGRERVQNVFSLNAFGDSLDSAVAGMLITRQSNLPLLASILFCIVLAVYF